MKYNKINIYNKHYSNNRINPDRPEWFDYEKTFLNLLNTINYNLCKLTVVFEKEEDFPNHFIKKYQKSFDFRVKFIDSSRDKWINKTSEDANWCRGIAAMCELIKNDNLPSDELIYTLDDDYLHTLYWSEIALDFINNYLSDNENACVCLYDHFDKYLFTQKSGTIDPWGTDLGMYENLLSKIRVSSYCHWRSVPNCVGSMIFPVNMFNRDFDPYWKMGYSDGSMSDILSKKYGTTYWTPIPSLSTHCVNPFIAPFKNWNQLINKI
jgi:hypothetical protein